jgi:hypothetical protein
MWSRAGSPARRIKMEEPMALECLICPLRWERYQQVFNDTHTREWLQFQAARGGLSAKALDAYGRDLDSYLRFLASTGTSFRLGRPKHVGCLHSEHYGTPCSESPEGWAGDEKGSFECHAATTHDCRSTLPRFPGGREHLHTKPASPGCGRAKFDSTPSPFGAWPAGGVFAVSALSSPDAVVGACAWIRKLKKS